MPAGCCFELVGFRPSLWLMAGMLVVVLVSVMASLPTRARQGKSLEIVCRTVCQDPARSIVISAARIFLFGSRDVWFVVGLPVFLYANGWKYIEVAGFIAAWTIGYGLVQAVAPSVVRRSPDGLSREIPEARLWGAVLTAIPAVLAVLLQARMCRQARRCWSLSVSAYSGLSSR